jgi:hypothetical protein
VIPKIALGAFLSVLMVTVGISSYLYLGARQSKIAAPPQLPTAAQPSPHAFALPGTLVLEQGGALYSLSSGRFHQLTPASGWTQPAFTPDGNLVVIRRSLFSSDVYTMTRFGRPIRQLTFNAAPKRSYDTGDNHWAFYPHPTPDGRTIFLSYDKPKFGYEVDMSIWAMPSGGGIGNGRIWSDVPARLASANEGYTGGDIQPIPVPGGLMYTKYLRATDGSIISQIWLTTTAGTYGKPLTTAAEDCREPQLSPDGRTLAMICAYGKQLSYLVIAPYSRGSIGPRKALLTNQMVAQPTWAPDGSGIAYLAPALPDGPFQLWFLPSQAYTPPSPSPSASPSQSHSPSPSPPASPSPSPSPLPRPSPVVVKPIQVTTNDGFDASSTLAWSR